MNNTINSISLILITLIIYQSNQPYHQINQLSSISTRERVLQEIIMGYILKKFRNILSILIATFAVLFVTSAFVTPAEAYVSTGARLSIPSIEVDAPIVTLGIRAFSNGDVTWDTTEITSQVGFLDGMAWFGQGGNTAIGGHSELADRVPAVFYQLDQVAVGDDIFVTVDGNQIHYRVTNTFTVRYTDLTILYPTSAEQLTLFTCDTASFNGGNYTRRDVVVAERVN